MSLIEPRLFRVWMDPEKAREVSCAHDYRLTDSCPMCDALDDESCASAAPEIVTGEQAAQLPVGSLFVKQYKGARVIAVLHGGEFTDPHVPDVAQYVLLYRAPVPPAPTIEVGQTLTTAAELDACPVGTALRARSGAGSFLVEYHGTNWYAAGDSEPFDRARLTGARVLDLGGAS